MTAPPAWRVNRSKTRAAARPLSTGRGERGLRRLEGQQDLGWSKVAAAIGVERTSGPPAVWFTPGQPLSPWRASSMPMDRRTRQLWGDIIESGVLSVALGALVAGLYRLFTGEVTWAFIGGDIVGIILGFSLLVATAPRRR
jgi:hypothetical protein